MGMGTICATMPAVAAALGIYFLDKTTLSKSNPMEFGESTKAITGGSMAVKDGKVLMKSSQMPKLAPHFDGLNSFETLVNP